LTAGGQDSIQARAAGAGMRLQLCNPATLGDGALWGAYQVFENRETKSGRKIGLTVVAPPSTAAKPAPEALSVFEGGPGAGAADRAKSGFRKESYANIRKERDIVCSSISAGREPQTGSTATSMQTAPIWRAISPRGSRWTGSGPAGSPSSNQPTFLCIQRPLR